MIVCKACGTSNADHERFCGQCGTFLDWAGAVVDRGTGGSTAKDDSAGTGGSAATSANSSAGTGSPAGAGSAGGAAVSAGATPDPDPPSGGATVETIAAPGDSATTQPIDERAAAVASLTEATSTTSQVTGAATARSADAQPVTEPTEARAGAATEVQPGASSEVQPGAPRRPRQVPQRPSAPKETPRPGDLICGQCGTGNDPVRRFCRSCGLLLADATPVRLPWWRRLWRWLTRRSRYVAGQRRQSRIRPRLAAVVKLLALIVVVALAVTFGPGLVRRAFDEVRDRTGKHEPVTPNGFTASSEREGAEANRIGDGASNRFWAPTGDGANSWVEASFAQPVRLLDVVVTPGISLKKDEFLTTGRPHELVVVATSESGEERTFTLNLGDAAGPQTFGVDARKVVRARITVRSTYGPADTAGVAVAEVEFFGRL